MKNPDVAVYPVAISSDKVQAMEPFTFNQLLKETSKKIDVVDLTLIMADKVAPGLSSEGQIDWITRRDIEETQLIYKYRSA